MQKKFALFASMMKNAFPFILKDIFILKIFKLLSWFFYDHVEKQLDKKAKVDFNNYTSQPGKQAITIHILSNNSISIRLEKLVPDHFFFFFLNYDVKASGLHLSFNIFWLPLAWTYSKSKLCKTLNCWSRDMAKFDFLEKGLGPVSPLHFVYDFSSKVFLILCSIDWPNVIFRSPLRLEIFGNTVCVL